MKFIALTSALAAVASATTYHASEAFQGDGFYTGFSFEAIPDPTNGRVQYVDKATAQANNLTFATDDIFILRADRWTTLTAGGPGRQSVRIQSTKAYTNHISVFNVRHMPQGCATWPAMWYADTNNWPGAGEIDVLEGVNDVMPNAASLHTTARCSMPGARTELGAAEQLDCNWLANGNAGCGVSMSTQDSYGPAFNANGGGWFVAERNSAGISVWFWARNDATVPLDVKERHNVVITETWGIPQAYFPDTTCDMETFFGPLRIIINLTLCGDWAGATFNSDGCSGSCIDLVNFSPDAFAEAYFDIANIDIYMA